MGQFVNGKYYMGWKDTLPYVAIQAIITGLSITCVVAGALNDSWLMVLGWMIPACLGIGFLVHICRNTANTWE
jgi:hypothetical protein